jgi:transcriptional regulator with XRE-family HTH domain
MAEANDMQGKELKAKRKALGLTQEQLALGLGMTQKYVGMMERDEAPIEQRTALAFCQIYNEKSRIYSSHDVAPTDRDIPLSDAMIIWDEDEQPRVKVVGPGEDDSRYSSSYGACNLDWVEADDVGRMLRLLSRFVELTTFAGIPPKEVHHAFSVIPEYRWWMSREMFDEGIEEE